MIKINGVVKNYDWGTRDYISSLFGGDEKEKKAEYWMGTHPKGEAVTENGEKLSKEIGHTLPFLFKVLSIASPLSLQCHPDKAQAEDGWKREKEIREKGGECSYMDDNEKAEILSAVTPVTALCGFKPFSVIISSLETRIPSSFEKYFSGYKTIEELFFASFSFKKEVKDELLEELEKSVSSSNAPSFDGDYLTEDGIIRETLEKYPGDIGSIFPLMMNIVRLKPGEALYLKPDTLHAYLIGNGIELMTASDNVLRGGLTSKRIDIKELERIMYFGETNAQCTKTDKENGILWYLTPSPDFRLGYIEKEGVFDIKNDSVILSFGNTTLSSKDDTRVLRRGESAYIAPGESVDIKTDAGVYIATSNR